MSCQNKGCNCSKPVDCEKLECYARELAAYVEKTKGCINGKIHEARCMSKKANDLREKAECLDKQADNILKETQEMSAKLDCLIKKTHMVMLKALECYKENKCQNICMEEIECDCYNECNCNCNCNDNNNNNNCYDPYENNSCCQDRNKRYYY